ncbi:uncharacterized protein DUF3592 [Streptomyces sp. 1114.5]|uniref:DUF3592 domain-containing protein n=1 Tax=Streptomyces sp. 1114.5 TaxID=1938830 RepID=UPI000EAB86AD|nr:DUF3592 domain-containing protein [Streptomyces sp. 1114.5]RKT17566.1 uncharacterized protein DUF3592 [Streptomyces sp. 1114.5]
MSDDGNVIGYVFGFIGLLVICGGLALPIAAARKARMRERILAVGLAAEARCLETYVTQERVSGSDSSDRRTRAVRHVIIGFRTADGRDIRFEDSSGVPRVVGDHVPVRYLPDMPHRAVTADRGRSGAKTGFAVAALVGLFFAGVGAAFAVSGFEIASGSHDLPTRPLPTGRSVPLPGGSLPSDIVCTGDGNATTLVCPDGFPDITVRP